MRRPPSPTLPREWGGSRTPPPLAGGGRRRGLPRLRPTHALLLATLLLFPLHALAVSNPADMLPDPVQEARARALGREIRCMVCQNQSIEDSEVSLARDLRLIVRERITAGDSDGQILAFLHARYGDFVLLKPPFKPATWILWFGPAAILLVGMAGIAVYLRRRPTPATAPGLSDAERKRLADLLKDR